MFATALLHRFVVQQYEVRFFTVSHVTAHAEQAKVEIKFEEWRQVDTFAVGWTYCDTHIANSSCPTRETTLGHTLIYCVM